MTYEETEWNMHEHGVQRLAPPGANRHLGLYSRQELKYELFSHIVISFPRHLFSALFFTQLFVLTSHPFSE